MQSNFKDHFSKQSGAYATSRPDYPTELFAWLASLVPSRNRVWDCATGNGQAAIVLKDYFAQVIATDASLQQLRSRRTHERVDYCAALAEAAPFAGASCDLVTVAQSVHWFNFERFYAEVRRVLRSHGVLALWTYATFRILPAIDAAVDRFYEQVVGPYWPPERIHVEQGYRTIPFPFDEVAAPGFLLERHWTIDEVVGYISTWSAVQRFKDTNASDPLPALRAELEPLFGAPDRRFAVRWPLYVRAGRI